MKHGFVLPDLTLKFDRDDSWLTNELESVESWSVDSAAHIALGNGVRTDYDQCGLLVLAWQLDVVSRYPRHRVLDVLRTHSWDPNCDTGEQQTRRERLQSALNYLSDLECVQDDAGSRLYDEIEVAIHRDVKSYTDETPISVWRHRGDGRTATHDLEADDTRADLESKAIDFLVETIAADPEEKSIPFVDEAGTTDTEGQVS